MSTVGLPARSRRRHVAVIGSVAVCIMLSLLAGASSSALDLNDPSLDLQKGTLAGSPDDDLPPHIEQVLPVGMRPDWSPDGTALLYQDAPLGDVWRLDLASGQRRNLTGPLDTFGFLRAHHLANGDLVLCGPDHEPAPNGAETGRFDGVLWVLPKPYTGPVVPLGRPCWEGIAVSRQHNRIAWNESDIDFSSAAGLVGALTGKSEIWMGDVTEGPDGRPSLTNVHRVATRLQTSLIAPIEVQDFRGPSERELIFTAYALLTGEVMGLDTVTRKITNYSRSPFYEEAEGVARNGTFVVVERDLWVNPIPGALDLWRLDLGGSGAWQRLTHFNRHRGYGASNPVVSPDNTKIAFQLSISEGAEGQGDGLYVLDLNRVPDDPRWP